jgi:hypothetical protein
MRVIMTTLAFVLAIAFGAGQSAKAADEARIAGTWNSKYGTVILNISPDGGISGFWNQDKGQGTISNGLFVGNRLEFSYHEPWNQANGTALFMLESNGRALTGRWTERDGQGKDTSGDWILTRD